MIDGSQEQGPPAPSGGNHKAISLMSWMYPQNSARTPWAGSGKRGDCSSLSFSWSFFHCVLFAEMKPILLYGTPFNFQGYCKFSWTIEKKFHTKFSQPKCVLSNGGSVIFCGQNGSSGVSSEDLIMFCPGCSERYRQFWTMQKVVGRYSEKVMPTEHLHIDMEIMDSNSNNYLRVLVFFYWNLFFLTNILRKNKNKRLTTAKLTLPSIC